MRHAVQQRGEVAGEVGVPGVRVHQVGAGAAVGDGQVDAEGRAARALAPASSARSAYDEVPRLVARRAEGVHARGEVVAGAQRADQLGDVHAGAAVDLGRVLLGQHVDSHDAEPTRRGPDYAVASHGYCRA